MREVCQKNIAMTLDEFRKWDMPKGWKMIDVSGEEKRGRPGSMDRYFMVYVMLQKREYDGM